MNTKIIQALQALRGVGLITAATLVSELGDITRFKKPEQLMSYAGIVPGEHSSGGKRNLGRITKTGNAHVRYVIVESSWHYRHNPRIGEKLKKRQNGLSPEIQAISWKAQNRLNKKFQKMVGRGKPRQVAAVAVGRELLGFIWAIANQVEKEEHKAA